jgi:dipeptidyl-peptidase-4
MDSPVENPEGYRAGSVLTYAPKLKGVLFLEHGALDDNVHTQNSVQFIDRLMDEDKDFGFMLMPKQRHGNRGKKLEFSNRRFINFLFKHFLNR